MGKGLAKQIKDKWPYVYSFYHTYCERFLEPQMIGKCQLVSIGPDKYVANLFGQKRYGLGLQTDYGAVAKALTSLKKKIDSKKYSFAIPYGMGCGLGGGDWNVVTAIIKQVFYDFDDRVVIYKLK
jgi:O-acetyl-ADP-ribose deacetylase (regulator of RNase III)